MARTAQHLDTIGIDEKQIAEKAAGVPLWRRRHRAAGIRRSRRCIVRPHATRKHPHQAAGSTELLHPNPGNVANGLSDGVLRPVAELLRIDHGQRLACSSTVCASAAAVTWTWVADALQLQASDPQSPCCSRIHADPFGLDEPKPAASASISHSPG